MSKTAVMLIGWALFSPYTAIVAADEIDAYVTHEMQAGNIPGVAVGILDRDRVTERAYGVANLETDTPVRTNSVFELASVTKPFTAMAVMVLVDEGKIRLDDPITTFIEHAPATWNGITVRQLLSHTSGLRGGGWVVCDGSPLLDISTRQHFDDIAKSPLLFSPGEGAAYSDPGYFLLGMIIEKVSGQRYNAFMQQHIFTPAGMTSTRILDRWEIVKGHVSCYTVRDGRLENGKRVWQHELPSYFGMPSTVDDLIKWGVALDKGLILNTNALSAMWAPTKLKNGEFARVDGELYGLGWFYLDVNGHRIVLHSGFLGSTLIRFVDDGLTIVVLTNLDAASGSHDQKLAYRLATRLRPEFAPVFAPYLKDGPGVSSNNPKSKEATP